MISKVLTFYTLGGISLVGAGLFPLGYIKSFNLFICLFIIGLVFILIGQTHKRKKNEEKKCSDCYKG